jgi:Zn-dependent protease
MLRTDIRVSPWFWLISVVLGWPYVRYGFHYLLIWVACVFVSILVHEFGHVLMGRVFGTQGQIVLYSFGGLAIGSSNLRNHWQRILVYLAGPGAGFVLWIVVAILDMALVSPDSDNLLLRMTLAFLWWINLAWGIVNLMPVYPLDGGQVSHDAFDWSMPGGKGVRISYAVSLGAAVLIALFFVWREQYYTAIMFGLLAVYSFQLFQSTQVRSSAYSADDRAPWEQDPDAWKQGGQRW